MENSENSNMQPSPNTKGKQPGNDNRENTKKTKHAEKNTPASYLSRYSRARSSPIIERPSMAFNIDPIVDLPNTMIAPKFHKFTLFPALPNEVRLKIWRISFPGPRVVKILTSEHDAPNKSLTSGAELPAALFVNYESRQEALRFYSLSFGTNASAHVQRSAKVYFNFAIDTLYLDFAGRMPHDVVNPIALTAMMPNITRTRKICNETADFEKVKSLAVRESIEAYIAFTRELSEEDHQRLMIHHFTGVRAHYWVIGAGDDHYDNGAKNYKSLVKIKRRDIKDWFSFVAQGRSWYSMQTAPGVKWQAAMCIRVSPLENH